MILPASCRVFWPEQTDLSEIVGWVEANSAAITVGTMGIAKSILSAGEGSIHLSRNRNAKAGGIDPQAIKVKRYGFQPLAFNSSLAFFTKLKSKISATLMSR